MSIIVRCECGRTLRARDAFAGKRANCPTCARIVIIPERSPEPVHAAVGNAAASTSPRPQAMEIIEFLDPPAEKNALPAEEKEPVLRRMFEALLDPRSIQWMLMIGGGLLVLGLIVLLINWLNLEAPFIIASSMGVGTLAVLAGGWYLSLKTKYKTAGRALTFLACVVAPLNLWYYHAQDILTLDDHLWIGGVICSLLYIATVRILRDPLFMYAVEAGITLTLLMFLPVVNIHLDATAVSIGLIVLGLISIHAERAFPADEGEFTRDRFGMPLFWCGQMQTAVALFVLLGSQILTWLHDPFVQLFGHGFQGNLLTDEPLLAGTVWLLGTYLYLYSDFVVRRVGVYVYVAAFSLLMAIVTIIGWQFESLEAVIITLAVVAVCTNLAQSQVVESSDKLNRVAAPLGCILSGIPLLIGWALHIRATSEIWTTTAPVEWLYVVAMLVVAGSNRISAHLCRHTSVAQMSGYLFFSAAGMLLAAAGLLPLLGLEEWYIQAPLLMVIPIGYIVASRLWQGKSLERPLAWIAHTATVVILFHVLASSLQNFSTVISPVQGQMQNLFLGLVFAEASLMYSLAGLFRKRSANAYFAAAAACGTLWQWMGYLDVAGHYHTMLYAVLGVAALIIARSLGLDEITVYRDDGQKTTARRGRGLSAFQSGNAVLCIALLSAFWQGFIRLFEGSPDWTENSVLLLTTAISFSAVRIVPLGAWRRVYAVASVLLASLAVLTISIEWLKMLSLGEQLELICVAAGVALLIAGHVGRFREKAGESEDMVSMALLLGSVLATVPLLMAVAYHRWLGDGISMRDEFGILTVTIVMLVTGYSWQTRSPTVFGGGCLSLYLIVLVAGLAQRAEEMMGIAIFMTIVGGLVFVAGIGLSVYRERLLELPDRIAKREGMFRVISWR